MSSQLTPQKGLIFRITHRGNVDWILDNGMHCANSGIADPNFVSIGNLELIAKRADREIDVGPGGTISDYVSFYFTPYSPMMLNIKTGYNGITRRDNADIVILVTSLSQLRKHDVEFVFSDRHAKLETASFYTDTSDLGVIDWEIIQARNFRRDPNDPEKMERYQAEALVHHHVPVEALAGLVCYNDHVALGLRNVLKSRGLSLPLHVKAGWYF